MIKSVIAGAVAMAVVSFGVNAAPTIPQGQGKVTFNGTVVDAPCSISQKSADQSIDFGQLSKSFLEAGGTSKPMDLDIELVNCDITAFKQGQALMNPLMIFTKIIRGFISAWQIIDMGETPVRDLQNGFSGPERKFSLRLRNCEFNSQGGNLFSDSRIRVTFDGSGVKRRISLIYPVRQKELICR